MQDEGTPEFCSALAKELVAERELLIAAWDRLESEKRNLQTRSTSCADAPAPLDLPSSDVRRPSPLPAPPSTEAKTAMRVSRALQFQYLQDEVDHRCPRP